MTRNRIIIDCYTDEPSGLGVPPYLGTWPRYVAGQYKETPQYLTIDDLRLAAIKTKIKPKNIDPPQGKTNIKLLNHTRSRDEIIDILKDTDQANIIAGVHTPGKYLSALPGSLKEIIKLIKKHKFRKILIGPIVTSGTQFRGGNAPEIPSTEFFDEIRDLRWGNYEPLQKIAENGAEILKQIPQHRIIEIETGSGCIRKTGCSFCTEPLKSKIQWRSPEQIIQEVKALKKIGATAFRLGKQSCIFSYQNGNYQKFEELFSKLAQLKLQVLHIDNANPDMVDEQRTRLLVKYLTPGSTAALGAESFDPKVREINNLNSTKEKIFEAITTINKIGGQRSETGMPYLLPGINILLGLEGETAETLEHNYNALTQLLNQNLLVGRINIRKVVPFEGTPLYDRVGNKFLKKNRKLYTRWIEKVRHEIDLPMLRKIYPEGTILEKLLSETHQGNVTFMRQLGSYPIIVGIRKRLPLGEFFDARILGHNPRSLEAELV